MKEKHIAMNKWFNYYVLLGVFMLLVGFFFIDGEEKSIGVLGFVCCPISFAMALLTEPLCYIFDSEGVSLVHVFHKKERYLWKNIRFITVGYESVYGSMRSKTITPSRSTFDIDGDVEGEEKRYMKHYIRKSIRTKYLIEKYWDGTVTGYDFENVKKKFLKWQAKKQKQIDAHFTDEAVKAEREVRAKVRNSVGACIENAKSCGIDIKVDYLYVISSGEELKARPDENYRYTACAEISYIGETDKDRVVVTDEDLLFVRFGKTGYKCTENKKAAETFLQTLEEIVLTIREKGIDYYCE